MSHGRNAPRKSASDSREIKSDHHSGGSTGGGGYQVDPNGGATVTPRAESGDPGNEWGIGPGSSTIYPGGNTAPNGGNTGPNGGNTWTIGPGTTTVTTGKKE